MKEWNDSHRNRIKRSGIDFNLKKIKKILKIADIKMKILHECHRRRCRFVLAQRIPQSCVRLLYINTSKYVYTLEY